MVSNSRKKTSLSRIRPLNQPWTIQVQEDVHEMPGRVNLRGREFSVLSILDIWEIADEWWRTDIISRRYYRLIIEGGKHIDIFRDLVSDVWYAQKM